MKVWGNADEPFLLKSENFILRSSSVHKYITFLLGILF